MEKYFYENIFAVIKFVGDKYEVSHIHMLGISGSTDAEVTRKMINK